MLATERDDLTHGLRPPVREIRPYLRCHIKLGYEVIVSLQLIELLLVVPRYDPVTVANLRELADPRRPKDQRQHVLAAEPALVAQILDYLPLSRTWHDVRES